MNAELLGKECSNESEATAETCESSSAATTISASKNGMKRVISFSTIEIREYNITLGDNPGGQNGPPVSLDWNYNKNLTQVLNVDLYEETRPPRRSRREMHMGSSVRNYLLIREQGFSLQDIRKAAKSAAAIRKQRHKTNNNLDQKVDPLKHISKLFTKKKQSLAKQ